VKQYPDSIAVTVPGALTQATGGNWIEGSPTAYTLDCRVETNTEARKIQGKDGAMVDYLFDCYLPLMSTVIPVGSDYVLTALSNGTISGKVIGAFNGQLNSRLWL
jgi:hypothetical protein